MAYSKIILNGETLMDVTSDTVAAGSLLSGKTATKNDGTKVTGNIASKTASDLTASGATVTAAAGYYPSAVSKAVATGTATTPATTITKNPTIGLTASTGVITASYTGSSSITPTVSAGYVTTGTAGTVTTTGTSTYQLTMRSAADMTVAAQSVTAPAGYYSQAFTKAVTTTTHPNPTAAIASSTGVVTATHTQGTGYVTGGTTTGTLNLTTQAATTYNTSTADQTIASNRWLTGTQTIKSVTTSNLTAANIAEGVVVKVGDANNASRITQITGTHSGATSYTATISGSGNSSYCYVTYSGTKYYTNGNTFTFKAGDTLTIYCRGNSLTVNGDAVSLSSYSYTYTLPVGDITINLSYSSSTSNNIKVWGLVQPTGTLTISAAGTHNTYKYSAATVAAGSAFPPAVTITTNPSISVNTSGVVTATYTGSSSITPTVTSGYVSQGTAGTVSTTGTSTYQLTSKAAATYNTSTADQTIASQRWLVGAQTIKSVTTSNLTAANIKSGTVVKVGDANNASRITQVTGTYAPTISSLTVTPTEGTQVFYGAGVDGYVPVTVGPIPNTYVQPSGTYNITSNGTYYVYSYVSASVNLPYYAIYQRLIDNATITASGSTTSPSYTANEFSSWCDSFGYINEFQFAGKTFSGSVIFNNVSRIGSFAFGFPNNYRMATPTGVFNFPIVTSLYSGVFEYNYTLKEVNMPNYSNIIPESTFYFCRDLLTVNIPNCSGIGSSAFCYCTNLLSVNFSKCEFISTSAFSNCTSMIEATFSSCTTIGSYAFHSCYSLTTISFPKCTTIDSYAFRFCSSLATISFPSCTTIGSYAFYYCNSLTTISFPKCTIIYPNAFYYCSSLSVIYFPECATISNSVFYGCGALTTISFPKCTIIGTYAFQYCRSLTTASFPKCESISSSAFYECNNLISLYLNSVSAIPTLGNYAFYSTPIGGYSTSAGRYGSIFVPASLFNSFKTATGWASYSSRMVSV